MSNGHNIPLLRDYPAFVSPRSEIEAGTTTIPYLYEWHARHNPEYPLFIFNDDKDTRSLTYGQAIKGIRRVAQAVRGLVATLERQVLVNMWSFEFATILCPSTDVLHARACGIYDLDFSHNFSKGYESRHHTTHQYHP